MPKHFPLALAILAWSTVGPMAAQTPDSAKAPMMMQMKDHAMGGWKEMDAFHLVVMQTWHPASMMKNLQPTREKAAMKEVHDSFEIVEKGCKPGATQPPPGFQVPTASAGSGSPACSLHLGS